MSATGYSTDEEQKKSLVSGTSQPLVDYDPEKDPELKKNNGKYDSKKAILQVTWRFPVDPNPLNIIALIYGYLPFLVPVLFFIDVVVERRFLPFYGLVVSAIVTVLNEVILKPIVKDPRPDGSANRQQNKETGKWEMKPGMPSGHVLNASTTMVWCLLEVSLRGPGFDDHPFLTYRLLFIILLLMAPVPWARIYNQDHSVAQCVVAGMIGIGAGVAAYFIRAQYFPLDAGKEWCISSACLQSGKPWDPFMQADEPSEPARLLAAAAHGMLRGS
eukprot:gb/GFBE01057808.1/.p1 GENE.gb/GFBE01057808.1/~~gb/GFBE01057808.1/.p1  ORF type:complete len:273 (+),score=52.24 gb/GFBE01057808.1/:1-819(+)